jgi:creatinine amidohydrolase
VPALPSRRWLDLTTEDFRSLPADTVAILPTAAVEQHGPHLPVSVDTTINEGIVGRALERAPDDLPVLTLPTMCVGKSDEHLAFPGTLALDERTTMDLWARVGHSVARAGIRRMVILNSHGGQMQLIEVVARRLRIEAGMFVVSCHWPRLWQGDPRVSAVEERHGIHGGQVETAVMLHLAPHLVRMDKAENFRSWGEDIDETNAILVPEGAVGFGWMAHDLNPAGALGDATKATADLGREIVEAVAERLLVLVGEVRGLDISRIDKAREAGR